MKLPLGTKRSRELVALMATWYPSMASMLDAPLGVTVEVKETKPRHTDPQRGLYWASLKGWGAHLGFSAKESETILHRAVCCEAYGVAKTVTINGHVFDIPAETSSTQDVEGYSILIDTMLRLAAETGYVVPEVA